MAIRPFDLIHRSLRKEVVVTMKNGATFSGKVMSYDENLNLFLSGAKETVENGREFKSIVLKGGNIVSISPVLD
jgi:small nuclear ribonucleoprotein (snRNP)-like protein